MSRFGPKKDGPITDEGRRQQEYQTAYWRHRSQSDPAWLEKRRSMARAYKLRKKAEREGVQP